jgi:ubiquinone/menaquinone biosynthesis C-methylase UbiE/uncharacterized protein YbaR (Trm112 family)
MSQSKFSKIWQDYLCLLCCPDCIDKNSDLIYECDDNGEKLVCSDCHQKFHIINAVPILLSRRHATIVSNIIQAAAEKISLMPVVENKISSLMDWKYLSYQYYSRFQEFKGSLKNFSSQNLVLDIGCAGGSLASNFTHYIGLDFSWKLISFARTYLDKPFVLADAQQIPFKRKSMPHVISRNMLEHTNNDQRIIQEMARVCCVNGIFELPCKDGVSFLIDPINTIRIKFGMPPKPFFAYGFGHINMQTEAEWMKRLQENGFTIMEKMNLGKGIFYKLFSCLEFILFSFGDNDDIPTKYVEKRFFRYLHPIYDFIYTLDPKIKKSWSKVFCVKLQNK